MPRDEVTKLRRSRQKRSRWQCGPFFEIFDYHYTFRNAEFGALVCRGAHTSNQLPRDASLHLNLGVANLESHMVRMTHILRDRVGSNPSTGFQFNDYQVASGNGSNQQCCGHCSTHNEANLHHWMNASWSISCHIPLKKRQVLLGKQVECEFAIAIESELSAIFRTIFPVP